MSDRAELVVELIGWPVFDPPEWYKKGDGSDGEELAEFAGRECYQSFDRPNAATATNAGYISNIIDHQHFSVLEHANYTFRISGVSRGLTHELVRHRHFSYSQRSQRYVDETDSRYVIPPVIRDLENRAMGIALEATLVRLFTQAKNDYRYIYNSLRTAGVDKKAARGAARSVLPSMTETSLVITGNLTAFREFFLKRISEHADKEIREEASEVYKQLRLKAPNAFQDWPDWTI